MYYHFIFIVFLLSSSFTQSCHTLKESQKHQKSSIRRTLNNNSNSKEPLQTQILKSKTQLIPKSQLLTPLGKLRWQSPMSSHKTFLEFIQIVTNRYKIKKIDQRQKIIETDWDIFYIHKKLFKNKLNIIIIPTNNKCNNRTYRKFPSTPNRTIVKFLI